MYSTFSYKKYNSHHFDELLNIVKGLRQRKKRQRINSAKLISQATARHRLRKQRDKPKAPVKPGFLPEDPLNIGPYRNLYLNRLHFHLQEDHNRRDERKLEESIQETHVADKP